VWSSELFSIYIGNHSVLPLKAFLLNSVASDALLDLFSAILNCLLTAKGWGYKHPSKC